MAHRYDDTASPQLTNEKLPAHRPVHLLAGMTVITEYSQVEGHVSMLLTVLAKGDPVPVAAIYGELRQGHIQGRALKAVAELVLSGGDYKLLIKLMKIAKDASDDRDTIAHRIWFYDTDLPNAVVLADPSVMWRTNHEVIVGGGPGKTTDEHALRVQKVMRDSCEIWTLEDLEKARIKSVHAITGLLAFSLMIRQLPTSASYGEERTKVENVIAMASSAASEPK